jgi:hypothetical protein
MGLEYYIPPPLRPSLRAFNEYLNPVEIIRQAQGSSGKFFGSLTDDKPGVDYGAGLDALLKTGEVVTLPLSYGLSRTAQPMKAAFTELLSPLGATDDVVDPLIKGAKQGVDKTRRNLLLGIASLPAIRAIDQLDIFPKKAIKSSVDILKGNIKASTALESKGAELSNQAAKIVTENILSTKKLPESYGTLNKQSNEFYEQLKEVKDAIANSSIEDLRKLSDVELDRLNQMLYFEPHSGIGTGDLLREKAIKEKLIKVLEERGRHNPFSFLDDLKVSSTKKKDLETTVNQEGVIDSLDIGQTFGDVQEGISLIPKPINTDIIKQMVSDSSKIVKRGDSLFAPESKKGKRLIVVSCSGSKCPLPGDKKAMDLYMGPVFQTLKKQNLKEEDFDVAILSAEHGLIRGDKRIFDYDRRMNTDRASEFLSNKDQVDTIKNTLSGYDEVILQGGKEYKDVIMGAAGDLDNITEVRSTGPKGSGIGYQRVNLAKAIKGDFGEDAYHYTKSRTPFEKFDIDETVKAANEYSESWIDFLGTHVGTKEAAGQRGSTRIADLEESGSFDAGIGKNKNFGHSLPLSIDTSKPFTPSTAGFKFPDLDEYDATDLGIPRWANFQKKAMEQDVWTEETLQDYIVNKVIGEDLSDLYQAREVPKEDILNLIADFRKKLAKEGHTNIPYINDYEDAGNISNVMLIDRAKSDPVIRSKLTAEPMAEGGIAGMEHIARNMFRGPRGISAFEQFVAKPQRPMVS